ncbi:hypothetical protein EUTSA_v10014499mg [Eutrema salsugineum]|uniref:Uncharacterized protein n=1 Tax=Eutrema salsugineum TaxID=72664 RepID=V4LLA4_EUTSA|nr:hypothetical protein EUTSA_v10014499mg [Eutrema salsugineum]
MKPFVISHNDHSSRTHGHELDRVMAISAHTQVLNHTDRSITRKRDQRKGNSQSLAVIPYGLILLISINFSQNKARVCNPASHKSPCFSRGVYLQLQMYEPCSFPQPNSTLFPSSPLCLGAVFSPWLRLRIYHRLHKHWTTKCAYRNSLVLIQIPCLLQTPRALCSCGLYSPLTKLPIQTHIEHVQESYEIRFHSFAFHTFEQLDYSLSVRVLRTGLEHRVPNPEVLQWRLVENSISSFENTTFRIQRD